MTISKARFQSIPKRKAESLSPVAKAVGCLKTGQMIEIDPFTSTAQGNALMAAKRIGRKVTTRKTSDGKLRVWRVK
jgi:hypothetical protein